MGKPTLGKSFSYAWSGILYTIAHERNIKIHLLALIAVVTAGWWLQISRIEWGLLWLTCFSVIVAEMINSAIENTVDLVTDKYHPLARAAKNAAAGAVLLSAVNALIMAYVIFAPYFK